MGALTLSGIVSPGFQVLAAPVLFVAGTVVGYAHGFALALLGRPERHSIGSAARCAAVAALLSVPAVACAWIVTAGITVTAALVVERRVGWIVLAVTAWVAGLALCVWAARETWLALRRAWSRFSCLRPAIAAAATALPLILLMLTRARPAFPGTAITLNWLGMLGVAVASTLWIILPLAFAVFWLLPRLTDSVLRNGEASL